MSVNDPIGDMLTRIRNAQERGKSKVSTPHSKLRENVLNVLQGEGFIRGYASVEHSSGQKELEIELKYFDGEPVIKDIKRVSTPGRRREQRRPRAPNGPGVSAPAPPCDRPPPSGPRGARPPA